MTYVDPLIDWGWKLGKSCHMIADNDAELHAMASQIGLKRIWCQVDKHGMKHYDLTASKRRLAVMNGAIELPLREFVEKMREIRADK